MSCFDCPCCPPGLPLLTQPRLAPQEVEAPEDSSTFLTAVDHDQIATVQELAQVLPTPLRSGDEVPSSIVPARFFQQASSPIFESLTGEGKVYWDPEVTRGGAA